MKPEQLINRLTRDKDERQELWVLFLEHKDTSLLSFNLSQIRNRIAVADLLQRDIWIYTSGLADSSWLTLLCSFTLLEQSVMSLLALGATTFEISAIRGIKSVRLNHIIAVIRENPCWNLNHGPKTKP